MQEPQQWNPICTRPTGLVRASRIDPTGRVGPTRRQAAGPRWDRVAPGWYAPVDRPDCVEQRILEQSCRLTEGRVGAATAWASLRWRGGGFFDGRGPGGFEILDVPLLIGTGSVRQFPGSRISKEQLAPSEREVIDGLAVTTVQRALFDEVRRRGELWSAVQAIDMAAAARMISVRLFWLYVVHRPAWEGVPLVRKALDLASDRSRSPRETWLRLVWVLLAELPPPLCNRPVFDRDGQLLGVPDLFDPVAGLVGEYDGAHHKDVVRHRSDVSREERFRKHGLEYFVVVQGDSREVASQRIRAARARAKFVPPESCSWTLTRPPWYVEPEALDDYLLRTGMVHELTHR